MSTFNIIKLNFLSPIHLGIGRDYYDTSAVGLHSDTLSAALASMNVRTQQDGLDVEAFLNSFTLSSAFPFIGQTLFLPKISGKLNLIVRNKSEHEYRKKIKKVQYIEKSIWEALANGETVTVDEDQIKDKYLVADPKEFVVPFKHQVSQRVGVPRDGRTNSLPFYFDWTFFNSNCGLYCVTDADGENFDRLCELFTTLGELGIGSDKSVGGGQFKVMPEKITIKEPLDANKTMILSLYIPTEEEITDLSLKESKYSLLLRGGYMAGSSNENLRHLWKKSIYMFDVGSCFSTKSKIKGKVVDLTPENWNGEKMHPVYRSGKAFTLKIKD